MTEINDTPQLLLSHHLKTLRLPTFLREYDKQAKQCAAEGVDHARYLLRLAELELIDRERRMVERRIKQAKFPATKSLDSFNFKVLPSLNKLQVMELARCDYICDCVEPVFIVPSRCFSSYFYACFVGYLFDDIEHCVADEGHVYGPVFGFEAASGRRGRPHPSPSAGDFRYPSGRVLRVTVGLL